VALHAEEGGFRLVLVHATYGGGGDIREGLPLTDLFDGPVRPSGLTVRSDGLV
jgi:hypothetical protein